MRLVTLMLEASGVRTALCVMLNLRPPITTTEAALKY
jgi:dihydroorotase